MSAVDDILSQIPLSQLAGQLGTDEATAEAAARSALPALLGGLEANAQDPAGAASLDQALTQHDPSLIDGGVNLDQVDPQQGEKIVNHIFGGNTQAVTSQLGGLDASAAGLTGQRGGAVGGDMIQKLLPILAPIVMSYLAKRLTQGGGGAQGGLGGILGSVLGGLGGGTAGGGQSGGLGDILGGLLGGGRR